MLQALDRSDQGSRAPERVSAHTAWGGGREERGPFALRDPSPRPWVSPLHTATGLPHPWVLVEGLLVPAGAGQRGPSPFPALGGAVKPLLPQFGVSK